MGQVKNGPSKICGRQSSKYFKWKQTISLEIFKGCPQILLGPFLNMLTQIIVCDFVKVVIVDFK